MSIRTVGVICGLAAIMVSGSACSKSEGAEPPKGSAPVTASGPTQVKVDENGFTPSNLRVEKGKSASLVFVRTTDTTCAKQVVFPELKLQKDLPLNTPVSVDVPSDATRTLTFQCGMGMFKSSVVIQ
jgi:plastocyanin domain-containing protein